MANLDKFLNEGEPAEFTDENGVRWVEWRPTLALSSEALVKPEADVNAGHVAIQNELLPCPFCGSTAQEESFMRAYIVHCSSDDCIASYFGVDFTSAQKARDAWNQRVAPSDPNGSKSANAELEKKDAPADHVKAAVLQNALDPVVEAVRSKLSERSVRGLSKYGVTVADAALSRVEWLIHAQEEALDLSIYLEKLLSENAPESSDASGIPNSPSSASSATVRGPDEGGFGERGATI